MLEPNRSPLPPVQLIEGLPIDRLDEQLALAFRGGDVFQRMQAFYLADLDRTGAYQLKGAASATDFACSRYGKEPRTVRELIQVGHALRELKLVDEAFGEGRINWSRARLLARICEVQTQEAWIERAQEVSIRQLERDVKCAQKGEKPRENRKGLAEVRLKVEVRVGSLTWELWEKCKAVLCAEKEVALGEEDVLRELCALLLSTRPDGSVAGRTPAREGLYQVIVDMRPEEGELEIRSEGGALELESRHLREVMRQAVFGMKRVAGEPTSEPTPAKLRRQILARDGQRCCHCGCKRDLNVHHIEWRSRGGLTEAANLACVCTRCHALIHAGLLCVEGRAPDGLRFLDREGRELGRPAFGGAEILGFEVQAAKPRPGITRGGARDGARDGASALPSEVDSEWWRENSHLFEWDDRKGTLRLKERGVGGAIAPFAAG